LKADSHIIVSSAETNGAFDMGFDTVNLHRPTACVLWGAEALSTDRAPDGMNPMPSRSVPNCRGLQLSTFRLNVSIF